MIAIKHLPMEIDILIEKLRDYANVKEYSMTQENKKDFAEIKFYNNKSPGLLRIYCTKKGITVDGNSGKNVELNEELINYINEISAKKESNEMRVNFKNVPEPEYQEIVKRISIYSDGDIRYYIKEIATGANEKYHLIIGNYKSKEEVHLVYYTNKSLYVRGFSWNMGEEIINIICKTIDRVDPQPMDFLNEIIHECNSKYITNDGEECTNCENTCYGDCSRLLQEIHYGNKARYSCDKVMNFYLPKYGYRYAFEIERLLQIYSSYIRRFESLNVLSIGCGPCTELFGLASLNNSYKKPIKYEGIDLNEKWSNVHSLIKSRFSNAFVLDFYYKDVFDYITQYNSGKCALENNIVIFQYVISDITKYKAKGEVETFLRSMVNEIVSYLPMGAIIIFNDINHKEKVRDYYDYIESILPDDNYEICKYHYRGKDEEYFNYGEVIEDSRVPYQVPEYIDNRYNPWIMCRSASLVIRKV